MQSTEKRLTDLENAQLPSEGMTIIRRMVAPGRLEAEINLIRDDHGNEWMRQTGETDAAFTDRATSETPPNEWGFRSLMGITLEHSHADN